MEVRGQKSEVGGQRERGIGQERLTIVFLRRGSEDAENRFICVKSPFFKSAGGRYIESRSDCIKK